VIFNRRPFYLIGLGAVVAIAAILYFGLPRVTPEQRAQEQVSIVAQEPWVQVRVDDVQYVGSGAPEQVLVRGVRLDSQAPVVIDFAAKGPYTAPSTLQRLTEASLAGRIADVKMLPRSMTHEPYRSQFDAGATHVGVAFFAGLPVDADAAASAASAQIATAASPPMSAAAASPAKAPASKAPAAAASAPVPSAEAAPPASAANEVAPLEEAPPPPDLSDAPPPPDVSEPAPPATSPSPTSTPNPGTDAAPATPPPAPTPHPSDG
jgi:hypothetical protein